MKLLILSVLLSYALALPHSPENRQRRDAPYAAAGPPSRYEDTLGGPQEEQSLPTIRDSATTFSDDARPSKEDTIDVPRPSLPETSLPESPQENVDGSPTTPSDELNESPAEKPLPSQPTLSELPTLVQTGPPAPLPLEPYPPTRGSAQDDSSQELPKEYGNLEKPLDEYGPPLVRENTPLLPPPPPLPELPPLIYVAPPAPERFLPSLPREEHRLIKVNTPLPPRPLPLPELPPLVYVEPPAPAPRDEYGPPLIQINRPSPPSPPPLPELPPLIYVAPPAPLVNLNTSPLPPARPLPELSPFIYIAPPAPIGPCPPLVPHGEFRPPLVNVNIPSLPPPPPLPNLPPLIYVAPPPQPPPEPIGQFSASVPDVEYGPPPKPPTTPITALPPSINSGPYPPALPVSSYGL